MIKRFEVKLHNLDSKLFSDCVLSYENAKRPYCLKFHHKNIGQKQFEGRDLFECLCSLRLVLEKHGYFILCNGARIDCYPSGMARDMGRGEKVYQLEIGKIFDRQNLVKTFDRAELSQVGTVEAQLAYYERWLRSLKVN